MLIAFFKVPWPLYRLHVKMGHKKLEFKSLYWYIKQDNNDYYYITCVAQLALQHKNNVV